MKKFTTFYEEGHRDLHNAFYQIKKILIFHEDMSRRSWCFIRVNRAFQGVFLEIVFLTILLEFLRYLLAVFDVMKVPILQKKSMEPIFDVLIL